MHFEQKAEKVAGFLRDLGISASVAFDQVRGYGIVVTENTDLDKMRDDILLITDNASGQDFILGTFDDIPFLGTNGARHQPI